MKTLILLLLICGVSINSKSQTYEVLTDTNFILFDYNPWRLWQQHCVPSGDEINDKITITKDFELPLGSELDLITHPCPE